WCAHSCCVFNALAPNVTDNCALHDALPIFDDPTISRESAIDAVRVDVFPGIHERAIDRRFFPAPDAENWPLSFGVASDDLAGTRSEEHTSELQSRENLVCRLLLEKKKQHIA